MPLRRLRGLVFTAAVAVTSTGEVRAQSAPLVLTRARVVAMSLERAPAVREANAQRRAAELVRDAAGAPLAYAPRVGAFAGRRSGAFGSGFEFGGSLAQELSLRGLGARRVELAEAVQRVASSDLDRARLEVAAVAVLSWIDVLEWQELEKTRLTARRDAEEVARIARARAERGAAPASEAALAAAEVGAAFVAERDAEGRLFEARTTLKFALGLSPATDVIAEGKLDDAKDVAVVTPRALTHPVRASAASRTALARAEGELARAQSSPTAGVGINYAREGTGEQLFTGTLSLPLPLLDPSRFDAARHETNIAAAAATAERVDMLLARDVAMADHERAHTREVRDTLAGRVVAPLRESVRIARVGFQSGSESATTFLLLRQRLVAAEEQLERSGADVQRADLRDELARGVLLVKETP